jgi:hypothetical protein
VAPHLRKSKAQDKTGSSPSERVRTKEQPANNQSCAKENKQTIEDGPSENDETGDKARRTGSIAITKTKQYLDDGQIREQNNYIVDTTISKTNSLSSENKAMHTSAEHFVPYFVRMTAPIPKSEITKIPPQSQTKMFSRQFLRKVLGGVLHNPGFYYVPLARGKSISSSRSWYGVKAETDPFLPTQPGEHGAKLVPFFKYVTYTRVVLEC